MDFNLALKSLYFGAGRELEMHLDAPFSKMELLRFRVAK